MALRWACLARFLLSALLPVVAFSPWVCFLFFFIRLRNAKPGEGKDLSSRSARFGRAAHGFARLAPKNGSPLAAVENDLNFIDYFSPKRI